MDNIERGYAIDADRWTRLSPDDQLAEAERLGTEWRKADDGWIACRDQLRGAVAEVEWLRAMLGRIAAGHTHSAKFAGEAIDESTGRLPLGGQYGMDNGGRDERYNPGGGVVGPSRQATCECCRRNDAPQDERLCGSCASHHQGAVALLREAATILDPPPTGGAVDHGLRS